MIHSILISGGSAGDRRNKTLEIIQSQGAKALSPSRCNTQDTSGFSLENNPDFIILKTDQEGGKENSIGISQIRNLQKKLSRKPFQSDFKVAFIPEAERMTPEAQNAFLKTLEEPPENTIIILSAPVAETLLPTIQSRCQIINLPGKNSTMFDKTQSLNQVKIVKEIFGKTKTGERILAIQTYAKNREIALDFCRQSIIALHQDFSQNPNLNIANILKALQKTQSLLEKNVNTKLTMENMVISF